MRIAGRPLVVIVTIAAATVLFSGACKRRAAAPAPAQTAEQAGDFPPGCVETDARPEIAAACMACLKQHTTSKPINDGCCGVTDPVGRQLCDDVAKCFRAGGPPSACATSMATRPPASAESTRRVAMTRAWQTVPASPRSPRRRVATSRRRRQTSPPQRRSSTGTARYSTRSAGRRTSRRWPAPFAGRVRDRNVTERDAATGGGGRGSQPRRPSAGGARARNASLHRPGAGR